MHEVYDDLDTEIFVRSKGYGVRPINKNSKYLSPDGVLEQYEMFGYMNMDSKLNAFSKRYFIGCADCHLGVITEKSL